MRQQMAQQKELRDQMKAKLGAQEEEATGNAMRAAAGGSTAVTPQQAFREEFSQDAKGNWVRKIKPIDKDAQRLTKARTKYYEERAGDVSDQQRERDIKENERRMSRYRQYFLDLEQRDPVIKEVRKQELSLQAVNALENLVEDGNTVAFSALGTKMARGMGEVGVLTEQDIKRYVRSGMVTQKAADTVSTWLRGKPTQATMDEIKGITNAMRLAFQEKVQPRYDQFIKTYSSIEKVTPEQFAADLKISYGGGKKPKIETQKTAEARFNELVAGGMSEDDAYKKLAEEGY
jgi:hypothetical protein